MVNEINAYDTTPRNSNVDGDLGPIYYGGEDTTHIFRVSIIILCFLKQ